MSMMLVGRPTLGLAEVYFAKKGNQANDWGSFAWWVWIWGLLKTNFA